MAQENGFQMGREDGWRLGFGNFLAKENRDWWHTSRWWMQTLIWLVLLGGFVVMVLFIIPGITAPDGEPVLDQAPISAAVQGFFGVGAMLLAIGITILLQDAVIGEKQTGTAEWVLSKPVSRPAFVLAKLVSNTFGMLVVMVAVPSAAVFLLVSSSVGEVHLFVPFAAGAVLLALHTFFYLALALMMGVLVSRREILLAVALGSLLGGSFIRNFIPASSLVTPWFLPDIAGLAAMGVELPVEMLLPIVMTGIWSLIFLVIALWRFQRHEF
jgi:ABC-2 type transport system permease protein